LKLQLPAKLFLPEKVRPDNQATVSGQALIGEADPNAPSRWVNGRSTGFEFKNQCLAAVGLELVANCRSQEWLMMNR